MARDGSGSKSFYVYSWRKQNDRMIDVRRKWWNSCKSSAFQLHKNTNWYLIQMRIRSIQHGTACSHHDGIMKISRLYWYAAIYLVKFIDRNYSNSDGVCVRISGYTASTGPVKQDDATLSWRTYGHQNGLMVVPKQKLPPPNQQMCG